MDILYRTIDVVRRIPLPLLLSFVAFSIFGALLLIYLALFIVAPEPRLSLPSEKTYRHIQSDGSLSKAKQLPCWLDQWAAQKLAQSKGSSSDLARQAVIEVENPEVFMSLVIPAYNEEKRLEVMMREAIAYLEQQYPFSPSHSTSTPNNKSKSKKANGSHSRKNTATTAAAADSIGLDEPVGWEILLVSDSSTDGTVDVALDLARSLLRSSSSAASASAIRVIELAENRGKGGAVTHGLRHVRGAYAVFADADGASLFSDLGKLVAACEEASLSSASPQDGKEEKGRRRRGPVVAVGSRAHLVGSEAVVKRSFLRNFLMHSFHLLLRMLTPPATGRIRDTQCGFKLFTRESLPFVVPYMHSEGWIFDVEMLMLAESGGIPVAEVPVGWKEVVGSKLNVVWDSLGMAWGLAVLRGAWGMGVYRRW